jgi:hypothetical protein
MSTTLYTPVDGAIGLQLASGYTAGAGSMTLKSGQGAFFVIFPTIITAITQGTYNTGGGEVLCEYSVTGKSGDTLTGVTAMSGFTDRNFATNDYIEGRVSSIYITSLNTVDAADAGTIAANLIKAGPTAGVAAVPNYRAAVPADLPSPLYAKFTYDTTNTCPQWTPIADPGTPALGDRWLSTASNSPVDCRVAGFNVRENGTFFSCGACTALSNFTGPTTLFGSASNILGSLTIPANTLAAGQIITWLPFGTWGVTTGSPTLTFNLLVNGSIIATSGAVAVSGSAITNKQWGLAGPELIITAGGSGGTCFVQGSINFFTGTAIVGGVYMTTGSSQSGTPVAFNTTISNAIDVQVACSAANTANTIQILASQWQISG